MSKTSSTELFDLIKSLSKAEKANFKLISSVYRSNKQEEQYIKLFDLISDLRVYDEIKILTRLKLDPKKMPDLKNYLQKRILFSLEVFHTKKSIRAEVNSLIEQCRILFKKNLLGLAQKKILKAISMAEEASLTNYLIEARELYLMTLWRPKGEDEMSLAYKEVFEKIDLNINQLKEYYEIRRLHAELYLFGLKTGAAVSGSNVTTIKKNIKDFHWLTNNKQASSLAAEILLLRQRHIFSIFLADQKNSNKNINEAHRLFNRFPVLKQVYYRDYFINLFNWLYNNIQDLPESDFDEAIQNVFNYIEDENESISMGIIFYLAKLKWYEINYKFKEGIDFFNKTSYINNTDTTTTTEDRVVLWISLINLYLQNIEPKKALIYTNKVLNEGYKNVRPDLFCFTKIQNILVQYALGNYDQLPYIANQAKRFMSKYSEPNLIYDLFIDFFCKNYKKLHLPAERKIALCELKFKLDQLLIVPALQRFNINYFNYSYWLSTQINIDRK